jgi:hypothetical protein
MPSPYPYSPPTTSRQTRKTRIVCISDTHNQTPALPEGDVLIHAGDLTNQGSLSEVGRTVAWLERVEFEVKIVVAGMCYGVFLYFICFYVVIGSFFFFPYS